MLQIVFHDVGTHGKMGGVPNGKLIVVRSSLGHCELCSGDVERCRVPVGAHTIIRNTLMSVATYPQYTSRAGRAGDVGDSVATSVGYTAKTRKHELRQRQKSTICVSAVKQCFASAPEQHDLRQRRKTVHCVSARNVRFTSAP